MKERRTDKQIYYELLVNLEHSKNKTRLFTVTGLSYDMGVKHLKYLNKRGWVDDMNITNEGRSYVEVFSKLLDSSYQLHAQFFKESVAMVVPTPDQKKDIESMIDTLQKLIT